MSHLLDPSTFDFRGYRMPAEWEPHEATWLAWPENTETWPEHLEEARRSHADMIAALSPHEEVRLLARNCGADDLLEAALSRPDVRRDRVRVAHIPYNDSWMRDAGPIFITHPGADLPRVAHDFVFNAWGHKYKNRQDDDLIPRRAAEMFGFPCLLHTDFVLEGGSIDVNGLGSLLTTRQCLLNKNRNPHLSQAAIEERLKRFLGVQRILWLGEGIEGDDTDGHVDDIARFVGPSRVLCVRENDRNDPNYAPLEANWRALKQLGDQDGNKLEVVDIPMPDLLLTGPHGRSPASYANFLIANNCVLVPVFSTPNQAAVLSVFRDLFPGRAIVPIECTGLVCGLGSIHCVTQQMPA